MIVLLVALVAAALAAENTRPILSKTSRNGRQAEVRIINRLVANSDRFLFLNGVNTTQKFNSATLQAFSFIGSGAAVSVGDNVNGGSFSDFEKIDSGEAGTATIRLNVTQVSSEACTITVNQGERVTIVVRQGGNDASFSSVSGSCSVGGASCTQTTLQTPGTVTISCSRISDNAADSSVGDCTDHPVRFYNFLTPSCSNQRLERLDVAVPANTELFLTSTVPTGDSSANSPVTFNRAQRFALNNIPLWSHGESRFTDVILTDGGIDVKQFNTSFINVVNVAFRVNVTESQLDNTFTYVIVRGSTLTANEVVHVQTGFGPQSAQGWIEVPANQPYTLFLFENTVSERDIFGDNSVTPSVSGTASAITNSDAVTLVANTMRIFRIQTAAQNGQATPTVNSVPLNGNDIVADNTKFITWNHVFSRTLQFAAASDECCGIVNAQTQHAGVFTVTLNRNSESLKVYDAGSGNITCKNIGATFSSQTFTLSQTVTDSDKCEVQGVFINGRIAAKNVTTSCGSFSGTGPCVNQVDAIHQINQFSLSEGFNLITLPVRMCSCAAAVSAPSCDVCEATKFAEMLDSVASTRAAVLSASSTSTALSNSIKSTLTLIQGQISATQKAVKKVGNTVDDIEDAVDDLTKKKN